MKLANYKPYQICTQCIMDTSDPEITFDDSGICSHCHSYNVKARKLVHDPNKTEKLEKIISLIKKQSNGRKYDCLIGLSGGVDSSYIAYLCKLHGLNPLAIHVDTGWNSELAVNNIEQLVKQLNIDLHTQVIDWETMRELQLAYFKASVTNLDIPSDHAILASLFKMAKKFKIKYILSGSNFATEFILPKSWGYTNKDLINIKSINRKHGKKSLRLFPKLGLIREVYYRFIKKICSINFLDFVEYDKESAKALLQNQFKWRDYGGKHYESQFTKFFQSYYLPKKFGYDKRRAHLSSLIVSHQISRAKALELISFPPYSDNVHHEIEYIAKKLGLKVEEFLKIIEASPKSHLDFNSCNIIFSNMKLLALLKRFGQMSL